MESEEILISRLRVLLARKMSDLAGRPMVDRPNAGIETSHATKARRDRNLIHRQAGFVDQLFGEVQTSCLRDRHWGRTQMPQEQASQMA